MKETVDLFRFCDVMTSSIHGFSLEGAKQVFEILHDFERENDIELEFDPIAIRSQFLEYESLEELAKDYPNYENYIYYGFSGGVIIDVESC